MNILIIGVAVWRLSYLLVEEEGPLGILSKFRTLIGVRYTTNLIHSEPYGTNVIAELFTCVFCLSLWIGAAAASLSVYSSVFEYITNAFAISAVAIFINVVFDKMIS